MNKRIIKDIKILDKNINLEIIDTRNIECDLTGPPNTPDENGKWRISIFFRDNYPFKSPSVGFKTKIYHPNIDLNSGSVCLNVLNKSWSPIYTVQHILDIFLPQLLTYPNVNDPLNIEAAHLYSNNYNMFLLS